MPEIEEECRIVCTVCGCTKTVTSLGKLIGLHFERGHKQMCSYCDSKIMELMEQTIKGDNQNIAIILRPRSQ